MRYAALVVAGVVTVGGAVAYGVRTYTARDATTADRPPSRPAAERPADERPATGRGAPVRPGDVTVAVLNGTTVDGLARRFGDQVQQEGFVLGTTATADDQARAESAVVWTDGARAEAGMVARRLGIAQIERADPAARALAGDAKVIVVLGADRSEVAAGG
jgi:hypothetical protein